MLFEVHNIADCIQQVDTGFCFSYVLEKRAISKLRVEEL